VAEELPEAAVVEVRARSDLRIVQLHVTRPLCALVRQATHRALQWRSLSLSAPAHGGAHGVERSRPRLSALAAHGTQREAQLQRRSQSRAQQAVARL
jgi:hypothetical protein